MIKKSNEIENILGASQEGGIHDKLQDLGVTPKTDAISEIESNYIL